MLETQAAPFARTSIACDSGAVARAFAAIARVQARGGIACWIDTPHSLDVSAARIAGVDVASLLISQPDTNAQGDEIARHLRRSGAVDLIIFHRERKP